MSTYWVVNALGPTIFKSTSGQCQWFEYCYGVWYPTHLKLKDTEVLYSATSFTDAVMYIVETYIEANDVKVLERWMAVL